METENFTHNLTVSDRKYTGNAGGEPIINCNVLLSPT